MIKYEGVGYNQQLDLNTLDKPLYLYLELTNSCNLNCKFCSVSEKKSCYMNLDIVKKVLNDMKRMNILDVYYTGGEPLLHPDFDEIVSYADQLGIRQTLLTNGLLLHKHIDILDKLMCICVSLHGKKNTHNKLTCSTCYDKVIDNIDISKKYTNVKISYTVTNDNQDLSEMTYVLDLAKGKNVSVAFAKYNNIGEGKKNNCSINIKKFVETMDKLKELGYIFSVNDCITSCVVDEKYLYLTHGCGAGYLFGSIDFNGNVTICPSSSVVIGNILKSDFKKIWNSKQMLQYRSLNWLPTYCKSCKNLSKCRGGCKAELNGKLTEMNDYLVTNEVNSIWEKIKNIELEVCISSFRKDGNCFVSLSNPPKKYNKEALDVIKMINSGIKPFELEEYKDFIISLYRDNIVREVKRNVEEKIER